jgi:5'(3')-deoxyribonucleotidase
MKLGFDIDGITCDMAQNMVSLINKRYDLEYDITVFKDHNIHNNMYTDDPELNEEIAMVMWTEIIENPEALVDLPVFEAAAEALRKFSRAGHTIHHVTARPSTQKEATIEWLRKNFIPFDTVHVTGTDGKEGAELKVGKGRLGRSLNLDFYLDDCSWHLYDMYRYKSRWHKGLGLFTQPWNEKEAVDLTRFFRFNDWKEIIRHLGIHKR